MRTCDNCCSCHITGELWIRKVVPMYVSIQVDEGLHPSLQFHIPVEAGALRLNTDSHIPYATRLTSDFRYRDSGSPQITDAGGGGARLLFPCVFWCPHRNFTRSSNNPKRCGFEN